MQPQPQPQTPFVLQVSQLTMQIKSSLESDFSYVEVEGEVSGFTHHNSGHIYFTLKDEHATLACTFFRHNVRNNPIKLQNGDKIIAKGSVSVYPPRGTYNLNIVQCVHSGMGNLKAQFEALKKSLEQRNYFCKNKPLPRFPKRIILLTSQTSAALQDMIKVASNRYCLCDFILLDTLTQGREAKYSIAKNLAYADRLGADILVLARGGGSIEDLWSFNEMEVLEAIYACQTPVVSAIGHEIDYLLSDYVADMRAPTPSAAMELILCDKESLLTQLCDMETLLTQTMHTNISQKRATLTHIQQSLELFNPAHKLAQHRTLLQTLTQQLSESMLWFYQKKRQMLTQQSENLEIAKPNHKLATMRNSLDSLRKNLDAQYSLLLERHRALYAPLKHSLNNAAQHFLAHKQATLPQILHETCRRALEQKRFTLDNLNAMLEALQPSKRVEVGFAQILKDNKPTQIADLTEGDIIEIVDSSGVKTAQIMS